MLVNEVDPKGLIRESYSIDGITLPECKTIFFDWAIQIEVKANPADHIQFCIDYYGAELQKHPMTKVLTEALAPAPAQKRRGGRSGRITDAGHRRDGQSE